MPHRTCPWWLGYLLACPLRRLAQDPARILAPFVHEGMTVLEPGPGMGFFTLELARRVGPSGRVIAVDIQPKMLGRLKRRAEKVRLGNRIDARLARADSMGIADAAGSVDFTLAAAVVHEMDDAGRFFSDVAQASRPGARMLLIEPAGHVKGPEFEAELKAAKAAGFAVEDGPAIRRSISALLKKN